MQTSHLTCSSAEKIMAVIDPSLADLAPGVLNATLGWAWADPIAGLVIAAVAVRERLEAWRGEGCACGPTVTDQAAIKASTGEDCADGCCTNLG